MTGQLRDKSKGEWTLKVVKECRLMTELDLKRRYTAASVVVLFLDFYNSLRPTYTHNSASYIQNDR